MFPQIIHLSKTYKHWILKSHRWLKMLFLTIGKNVLCNVNKFIQTKFDIKGKDVAQIIQLNFTLYLIKK